MWKMEGGVKLPEVRIRERKVRNPLFLLRE